MTDWTILDRLEATLRTRQGADPASSYTAQLFDKGTAKIAQKVGEEGVELALAAATGDKNGVSNEAADLLYHMMILLLDQGLSLGDVLAVLAAREGTSGLTEKANRSKGGTQTEP